MLKRACFTTKNDPLSQLSSSRLWIRFSLTVVGCEWMLGLTSVLAMQNPMAMRKHLCTNGQPCPTPGTANTAKSAGTCRFPARHSQGVPAVPLKDSCNKWSSFPSWVHAFCFNFSVCSILYFHIYPEAHFKSPLEKWHTYFISDSVIVSLYKETSVLYSNRISLDAFTIAINKPRKEEWGKVAGVKLGGTHFRRSFSNYQTKLLYKSYSLGQKNSAWKYFFPFFPSIHLNAHCGNYWL